MSTGQGDHRFLRGAVLDEVREECNRQDEKWGAIRDYPDGTALYRKSDADSAKATTDFAVGTNRLSWLLILREEVYEAFAEVATDRLRAELIQVAAVCVNWIMALDRRKCGE